MGEEVAADTSVKEPGSDEMSEVHSCLLYLLKITEHPATDQ